MLGSFGAEQKRSLFRRELADIVTMKSVTGQMIQRALDKVFAPDNPGECIR
jgi:hypothetical protein